jgi:hypothetical protein
MNLVSSLLILYTWGVVCVLLFFLFSIARFYQRKSGRRSFYPSFLLPIGFFAIAAVRYAVPAPGIVGDLWGDVLRFAGAIILGGFGIFLLNLMIGGRS